MSVVGLGLAPVRIAQPDAQQVRFREFVELFCARFKDRGMLDGVDCRQSHRDYVFKYFSQTFTNATGINGRHWRWFARLAPIFALPRGARVLDYGGGYGMDSVFLASCGYAVTLFEVSPHHLAIARRFGEEMAKIAGRFQLEFVQGTPATDAPPEVPPQDALLLDEVAHHIEPPERLFARCARILRPNGSLFLLEPNFWSPLVQAYFLKVRGLKTTVAMTDEITGEPYLYGNEHIRPRTKWIAHAKGAGLSLRETRFIGPTGRILDGIPLVREVAASHLTMRFEKT